MVSDVVRSGGLLVALCVASTSALARDLDLGIFPGAEQEQRVGPAQPVRPREGTSRPAAPARPEVRETPSTQRGKQIDSAGARSPEERQKRLREAAALFSLETTEFTLLKQRDPAVECYGEMCVSKRASLFGFRGMNVCLSDTSMTVKQGRIVSVHCDVALSTARSINADLSDLLGAPAYTQAAMSAHATWVADKREVQVVLWKGTNVHGAPYEKWTVYLKER